MIVGIDGTPLSKRHGSRGIQELRDTGYLPEAVNNHLARLGHHYDDDGLFSLDDLARRFDIARLGLSPARFDTIQLLHWQHQAVMHADAQRLCGDQGTGGGLRDRTAFK